MIHEQNVNKRVRGDAKVSRPILRTIIYGSKPLPIKDSCYCADSWSEGLIVGAFTKPNYVNRKSEEHDHYNSTTHPTLTQTRSIGKINYHR